MVALISLILASCGNKSADTDTDIKPDTQKTYSWKLVTTWPKNYPGLGSAPENFAKKIAAMSGGRIKIKVFGAGQLVPAFEVFDAVSQGTAQVGHGAAYYWTGKA
jgi:TRAP-type mannitol/chloroaromatic compound transport system substrate-binding protein